MPQGGLLGEEPFHVAGGVVDREAGVGLAAEGVEDFSFGGALVGEDAAVVEVREAGHVPGMGRLPAPALGGVAGEALQGGGAEEVDVGPGASLDSVDGAGPGVRAVRAAVAAVAGDEGSGQHDGPVALGDGAESVIADGSDGEHGAVVEALPVGAERAVDEDAAAAGVAAFPVPPGGPGEFRADDVARG